jgi:drug/metabolite transporter (DMT)-like permease
MSTAAAAAGPEQRARRARLIATLLVILAATLWSTSGLVFRLLEETEQWRIVAWRSGTLAPFLLVLMLIRARGRPIRMIRAAGWPAVLAGLFLGGAFTFWILALGATSVANAVFLLCCSPVASVLLARAFLGEAITRATALAVLGVIAGTLVINAGAMQAGGLAGNLWALATAFAFAAYTVTVRFKHSTDMLPAVFYAAVFSAVAGLVVMEGDIAIRPRDALLSVILGVVQVGIGLVLFTAGARHLPAVELTLLSLIEVVLAPIWVWALLGEQPATQTLIGGLIMLAAVSLPALWRPART